MLRMHSLTENPCRPIRFCFFGVFGKSGKKKMVVSSPRVTLRRFSVVIFALACICITYADVYLSPAGKGVWDGSCSAGSCISADTPCDLPTSAIVVGESTCIVRLVAFDYAKPNGDLGVLEIAQKSSMTNITFVFQAGSDNAVVNHLALTVRAETVQFSGEVADSRITVDFLMAKAVAVQDLVANQTQFFFSGAQPLRLIPSVSVKNSKLSLTSNDAPTNGLNYLFVRSLFFHPHSAVMVSYTF